MDAKEFTAAYAEAFGPAAQLPLLFWYSEEPVRAVPKVEGCFFKALAEAGQGLPVSLNAGNIGCGGGKFYTGFTPMPPFVPTFVSQKEHYKQTPEMVLEFIDRLGIPEASGAWLNFARIDTDAGLVRQQRRRRRARALRIGMQRRRDAGRRGEPTGWPQRLSGAVRPLGASVGRGVGAEPGCADVAHA